MSRWGAEPSWTDERVEALRKFYTRGHSFSQIAAELSGPPFDKLPEITRNAAIGKAHRLNLVAREKGPSQGAEARKVKRKEKPDAQQPAAPARPTITLRQLLAQARDDVAVNEKHAGHISDAADFDAAAVSADDAKIPIERRVTLQDLTDDTCRWPIGDPSSPDFFFCGARPFPGAPYCAPHCRAAYGPREDGRRTISDEERARRALRMRLYRQNRAASA